MRVSACRLLCMSTLLYALPCFIQTHIRGMTGKQPRNRCKSVSAEVMSVAVKTEAIVVWDIENNRVPTQLISRCFEIVQWLLQDVQKNCPHATVLRVYVAGTFDKYPSQLKNALCTHPRVQMLYSIGKIAKGGEADDALKRVMLDFHTTQLIARKQALIVLLSGDADYNDVVDAARIAGHKVHLYHSHSVAHTLQGNVDHHEAWHAFLARKSGERVEELEDTGLMLRGMSPVAFKSAGTPALYRRVLHSHPGLKPIALPPQLAPTQNQATSSHHRQSYTPAAATDTDSAMQTPPPPQPGRTIAVTRHKHQSAAAGPASRASFSSTQKAGDSVTWVAAQAEAQSATQAEAQSTAHAEAQSAAQAEPQCEAQFWSDLPEQQRQAASLEQPSQAPQDSGDSGDPPQPHRRAPRAFRHPPTASWRQPSALLPVASQSAGQVDIAGQGRQHGSPGRSAYCGQPPGFANPRSDGRTVVVSGFRKGSSGPQAKQQTLDMCAEFGDVSCCWLRKGRSCCWFSIVQFADVSSAQVAVQQCCERSTCSGCLGVRWYLTEAPSAHLAQTHHAAKLQQQRQVSSATAQLDPDPSLGQPSNHERCAQQGGAVLHTSQLHSNDKWVPRSTGTLLRVLLSSALLCGYCVLLLIGY